MGRAGLTQCCISNGRLSENFTRVRNKKTALHPYYVDEIVLALLGLQTRGRVTGNRQFRSPYVKRAETTLAGIFDGGRRAGNLHGLRMYVRSVTRLPGVARASGAS